MQSILYRLGEWIIIGYVLAANALADIKAKARRRR
jgi:hypothetical protein